MSNAFVFADCFNTAKEILAKPQMSEKVLIDLLLHLDGKSPEEVKQIVSLLVEKVDKETGETVSKIVDGALASSVVLETRVVEEPKVEDAVEEVKDAVEEVKDAVEEVKDAVEDGVKKVVDEVTRVVDVVSSSVCGCQYWMVVEKSRWRWWCCK
jgi:hypothetical protein